MFNFHRREHHITVNNYTDLTIIFRWYQVLENEAVGEPLCLDVPPHEKKEIDLSRSKPPIYFKAFTPQHDLVREGILANLSTVTFTPEKLKGVVIVGPPTPEWSVDRVADFLAQQESIKVLLLRSSSSSTNRFRSLLRSSDTKRSMARCCTCFRKRNSNNLGFTATSGSPPCG
jgi:hypothetical protein